MLVLDAFKGHLTLEISATITRSSMNISSCIVGGSLEGTLDLS